MMKRYFIKAIILIVFFILTSLSYSIEKYELDVIINIINKKSSEILDLNDVIKSKSNKALQFYEIEKTGYGKLNLLENKENGNVIYITELNNSIGYIELFNKIFIITNYKNNKLKYHSTVFILNENKIEKIELYNKIDYILSYKKYDKKEYKFNEIKFVNNEFDQDFLKNMVGKEVDIIKGDYYNRYEYDIDNDGIMEFILLDEKLDATNLEYRKIIFLTNELKNNKKLNDSISNKVKSWNDTFMRVISENNDLYLEIVEESLKKSIYKITKENNLEKVLEYKGKLISKMK